MVFMDSLTANLLKALRYHDLLEGQTTILVAVSGGVDSLSLFHMLLQLQKLLDIKIVAATFDHQLRENSATDATRLKSIIEGWGAVCLLGSEDVRAWAADNRVGIEEAARIRRYRFLARVAQQVEAHLIVTAHHADDQAESILMHLVRGAGLAGLGGMRWKSPLPGQPDLTLVRPLLATSRSELEAYCQRWDLKAIEDPTNADVSIPRNYIRHKIMPRLRQLNPQVATGLYRLGELTRADADYLADVYESSVQTLVVSKEEDLFHLSRMEYETLHVAMKRRLIRDVAGRLIGQQSITFHHVDHAVALADQGVVGQIAEFAGKFKMLVDYHDLWFGTDRSLLGLHDHVYNLLSPNTCLSVPIPGRVALPGGTLYLSTTSSSNARIYIAAQTASVILRTRKSGDRFQPPGLDGSTKKLKKWLIDRKIPASVRDGIPLLVVDDQIAAIVLGNTIVVSQDFMVPHDDKVLVSIFVKNS